MTGRNEESCKDGTFVVGAVAAAPPAITKDTPAAPNAGKAILRRFRFETRFACAIVALRCLRTDLEILDWDMLIL